MKNEEIRSKFHAIVALIVVFTTTSLLVKLGDIVLDKLRQNTSDAIDVPDNFPDFEDPVVIGDQYEIKLYENFIMTDPINTQNIIDISRVIRVTGTVDRAVLKIRASASEYNNDPTRRHTVYFYIDDGENGGHLGVEKKNDLYFGGYFTSKDGKFLREFDLRTTQISVSPDGSRMIDFLSILNDGKPHYVGSFVSTGIYGVLDSLSIEYSCVEYSECSIKAVR